MGFLTLLSVYAKINGRKGYGAMVLPAFAAEGVLPPGDYPLTVQELRSSFLVTGGDVHSPTWDGDWRRFLVGNL
jgi:hypothetical protein